MCLSRKDYPPALPQNKACVYSPLLYTKPQLIHILFYNQLWSIKQVEVGRFWVMADDVLPDLTLLHALMTASSSGFAWCQAKMSSRVPWFQEHVLDVKHIFIN